MAIDTTESLHTNGNAQDEKMDMSESPTDMNPERCEEEREETDNREEEEHNVTGKQRRGERRGRE